MITCGPRRCCGSRPQCLDAEQVLAGPVFRELRMRKAPAEVEALWDAAAAIDRVHARMGEWLRAGRTEREVGRDVADAIIGEGHQRVDFVIVACGPNSASPHHGGSDRVIEAGDPVVVDIGGTMPSGYCSDETRTYVMGGPPDGYVDAYETLRRAQAAAIERVRPGVTAESVDAAARDVLTAARAGRLLRPPHRARYRPGDPRGSVHRGREYPFARTGHGVLH